MHCHRVQPQQIADRYPCSPQYARVDALRERMEELDLGDADVWPLQKSSLADLSKLVSGILSPYVPCSSCHIILWGGSPAKTFTLHA